MNDEAAWEGRPDTDHLASILAVAAALPDPALYRQQLPGSFWRKWEFGEIGSREEFWRELGRLWGVQEVLELIAGRRAA